MRAKPLILIVDDEENFLEIFSAKLQAAGFETVTAKNEAEAVQKSKELMPDLILMDIFMPPGLTGTDIALNIIVPGDSFKIIFAKISVTGESAYPVVNTVLI